MTIPLRPATQWYAELSEYLPGAYVRAHCRDFEVLRIIEGIGPRLAAMYARIFLLGPDIGPPSAECPIPDYAPVSR